MNNLLLVVMAAALLAPGCAHMDAARLDAAARALPDDWGAILAAHRVRPGEVRRVDYVAGVLHLRVEQPLFWQWVPLGVHAWEYGGVVSSRKEWLSRSAIIPDLAAWGVMAGGAAGAGLLAILPIYQITEEHFHARDEALHPEAWKAAENVFRYLGPLRLLPPFYLLDPREMKAKLTKIIMGGCVANLDCPAARERWESLLWAVALGQFAERGRGWPSGADDWASVAARKEELRGSLIDPRRPDGTRRSYWHPGFYDGIFEDEIHRGETARTWPRWL